MGEALLMNHGGMRFKELVLLSPPEKQIYVIGTGIKDYYDLTGAKIAARVGRDLITLTEDNYSFPSGYPTTSISTIPVEATIGSTTRTLLIPVTSVGPDPVLNNNSWHVISVVSAAGKASDYWSVGDTKSETIGGVTRSFRIIGFDHDDLAPSDPMNSNAEYNAAAYDSTNQIRYAGITFQAVESFGTSQMNTTLTNLGGWASCYIRNTTMQTALGNLSQDMRDVIRTVNIRASVGGYGSLPASQLNVSEDELFLISAVEMVANTSTAAPAERNALSVYEYYTNASLSKANTSEWTRSAHDPTVCEDTRHFVYLGTSGTLDGNGATTSSFDYYPAFCV